MSERNEIGTRNEHWRRRFATGPAPEPKYARLLLTRGVTAHTRGMEAVAALLCGPEQDSDDIDPRGERDMLVLTLGGTKFYLKWDMFSAEEELRFYSEDPSNDEVTTRVATILLADEY